MLFSSLCLIQLCQAFEANILPLKNMTLLCASAENTPILVLFENDGCSVHINLQRILLCNIQRAAQLCRQNDSAELVNLSYDSGRFHTYSPFSDLTFFYYVTIRRQSQLKIGNYFIYYSLI